jgi:hypothetical protein
MFRSTQYGLCMGVCLWFVNSRQQLSAPLATCSQLRLVSNVVRRGAVYFRATCISVCTHVKYKSARKFQQKFQKKFYDERVPSGQTVHNFVNKLRITGLLIDKKQKHKCWALTEEKLDDIGGRLEHTPRKSLYLAQETGVSKSNARMATQLLKLRPYKTSVSCVIQLAGFIFAVGFYNLLSKVRSVHI